MTQTLTAAAAALRHSGAQIDAVGAVLGGLVVDADAFGASGPGRLGELGRLLYALGEQAVEARVREARAHAGRLGATADALDQAGHHYAEVDRQPQHRKGSR